MFFHQLANAAVALCACCAALANKQAALIRPLCAWCVLDFVFIALYSEEGARKQSLLVHHVFMAALCVFFETEGESLDREPLARLARLVCLFEVSTIFVCAYNCFPRAKYLRTARDLAFVAVRGLGGALVLQKQFLYASQLKTRHQACLVALVALSAAWAGGKSLVGRHAYLLAYAVPLAAAWRVVGSAQHVVFVLAGATGSFFFYERGEPRPDRSAITAHVLYRFFTSMDKDRWAYFLVAASAGSAFHLFAPDGIGRDVNNALVPLLALQLSASRGAVSGDLVGGLFALGAYLALGGPKKVSFGHRIAWHVATNCVASELIRSGAP